MAPINRPSIISPFPSLIQAQPEVEGKGKRAKAAREGLAISSRPAAAQALADYCAGMPISAGVVPINSRAMA